MQESMYIFEFLSSINHFLVEIYVDLFIHIHFPWTELQ